MTVKDYQITGMTCDHCENSVREEVGALTGVHTVEVSAATGTLTVHATAEIDDAQVLAAVEEAGYSATAQ